MNVALHCAATSIRDTAFVATVVLSSSSSDSAHVPSDSARMVVIWWCINLYNFKV